MKTPNPGLKPMAPGLRTVHYDARSAAKVSLLVQPGETLIVSDDVAAQLTANSAQFKTETVDEPPAPTVEPPVDAPAPDAAGDEGAPAPAKRTARKQAAKPKG